MYKCEFVFVALQLAMFCFVATSLPCGQDWSALASCLQMGATQTSSDDILKFIQSHGYLIVPQSILPPKVQLTPKPRIKRAVSQPPALFTGKCPYKIEVKDLIDTVPRFVSNATCKGCDVRCKPVVFTQRLLRKKCHDFWLWEDHDVRVAYVLEQ